LSLSFENSCGRYAYVVIVFKSGANEALQLFVLEDFPPFLVTE
jgi:hypothetical protein